MLQEVDGCPFSYKFNLLSLEIWKDPSVRTGSVQLTEPLEDMNPGKPTPSHEGLHMVAYETKCGSHTATRDLEIVTYQRMRGLRYG